MKIVIPSLYLGRTLQTWLCYKRIPFWYGSKSGVLQLNEVVAHVPVPFLRIAQDKGGSDAN